MSESCRWVIQCRLRARRPRVSNKGLSLSTTHLHFTPVHVITVSEDEVRRELKRVNVRKAARPHWLLAVSWGSALISLLVCLLQSLMSPLLPLWFPPPLKNLSSCLCLRTVNPLAWMTIIQLPSHQQSQRFLRDFKKNTFAPPSLLLWTLFSLPIGQIDQLMMPSLRSCTLPLHTLTAKMATMSGCFSLTTSQLSIL